MMEIITVAVVDDHTTFSELLSRALDAEPDVKCVGTAADAMTGARLVENTRPDVVVMDVQLGEGDGIALTAQLTARHPGLRVIVLTARTDALLVQRAGAAGACCLLPKDGSLEEVLGSIRSARAGGLTVHPQLMRTLMVPPQHSAPTVHLTEREREVLALLAEGRSACLIARELRISEHTARGHVKNLLIKLDAHSQLEAVAVAGRQGLL